MNLSSNLLGQAILMKGPMSESNSERATQYEMLKTDQALQYKVLGTILPFILKGSRHSIVLIDKGLSDKWGVRRLETNTGLHRTSLRLVIQNDMVFILSHDAHGPKNIMEGHERNMTKGNEAHKECGLRRRVFVKKGNNETLTHEKEKSYQTTY